MSHQVALTFCAEVEPGRRAELDQLLSEMARNPSGNAVLPFAEMPHTHFARLLVLDAASVHTRRDVLVLTLDCDAEVEDRLRDLVRLAGDGVDLLFGTCADYPSRPTEGVRADYLRDHLRGSQVFYVHAVGRTLDQILDEHRLRCAVDGLVDREADWLGRMDGKGIHQAVRAFVAGDPGLSWALEPAAPPELSFRLRETAHKVAVPAVLLLGLPLLVPAAAAWVVGLRLHELVDPFPEVEPDPQCLRALGDAEDYLTQNAFTSLAPIRAGRFWRLTSELSLLLGNYMARHVFTTGSLSGLTTVHFARFMKLGPDEQLLFTSYYDGSLESYNNDFVDQVAWVLNTVFGQQQGYPRTRWLVNDGAHNERWFKNFIRGHQVATPVWWSAYPTLAAVTIDQNARFRQGLGSDLDGEELEAWLRLL